MYSFVCGTAMELLHEIALLRGVTWCLFVLVNSTRRSMYVSPVLCSDHITYVYLLSF